MLYTKDIVSADPYNMHSYIWGPWWCLGAPIYQCGPMFSLRKQTIISPVSHTIQYYTIQCYLNHPSDLSFFQHQNKILYMIRNGGWFWYKMAGVVERRVCIYCVALMWLLLDQNFKYFSCLIKMFFRKNKMVHFHRKIAIWLSFVFVFLKTWFTYSGGRFWL